MRYKILGLISAVALVAACETAPKSGASAGGGGGPSETYTTPLSGGPASVRPGSQEDLVVNVGDRIYFGFDKFNLKADARQTLDKQGVWLKANPSVTVTIEGHCDERGTRE